MKTYEYSYVLGDMYHSGLIDAPNEFEALTAIMKKIRKPEIMHCFKFQRHFEEWN